MRRDLHQALERLSSDTAKLLNHGGVAAVALWQALWSLVETALLAAAAGARWMRRQPDARRQRRTDLERRLRERDRVTAIRKL